MFSSVGFSPVINSMSSDIVSRICMVDSLEFIFLIFINDLYISDCVVVDSLMPGSIWEGGICRFIMLVMSKSSPRFASLSASSFPSMPE